MFLDEIGELPLALQPKLLRVLQEHTFERVGSTVPIHADVRVVAATNRRLDQEVMSKNFRADLFYRLNTYTLLLPPLRERSADILPLAEYFLEQHARRNGLPLQSLTAAAAEAITKYPFLGNVRELEHLMNTAAVQAGGRIITIEEIQRQLVETRGIHEKLSLETLLALPFHEAIRRLEQKLLENAMQLAGDNKSEAARSLGIHRRLLYEKLQQYNLI